MRVARRNFLASALASIAAPAVLRAAVLDTAWADAPITLKLHHAASAVSSIHDKFLVPWARKVEAELAGRLRIDIFPSMQLGGAPAGLFDQARDGAADIAWALPSHTAGRFPKIETFELPFLPSRRALVSSKALQDFAAANLKDEFHEIYPLCFSCSDRAVVHANQAVRTIDDIKDLKIHVQTRLAAEAMRVLGAHPVPMPSAQLPLAISEHVVDGCIDPWHLVPPLRLNDLLKTHTEFSDSSLSSRTYVLAMNKPAYDRLPRDLKAVIDNNSGQFAAGMAGTMWDLQAAAVADNVVARGDVIVTLLPEAVAHWRKATEPAVDAWLKGMKEQKADGAKLVASARALLAKYANEPEPQPPLAAAPPQQDAATQPAPSPLASSPPAPSPPASSSPTPAPKPSAPPAVTAKPAPAPAPHVATPAPGTPPPVTAPHVATPATPPPVTTPPPSAPIVKPVPAPPPVATAPPPAPPPPPPPPTVAAVPPPPSPAPAAPVPKLVPKALDIPL